MSKSDSPMDLLLLQMCPLSRHLNLSKKNPLSSYSCHHRCSCKQVAAFVCKGRTASKHSTYKYFRTHLLAANVSYPTSYISGHLS